MKKYKLIKEYPGSPKLGYIIGSRYTISPQCYWQGSRFEPKAFSEHWEEVIEKDYEILRYMLRLVDDPCDSGYDPDYHTITSIKRLSDGKVFTTGDIVEDLNKNPLPYKIMHIELKEGNIRFFNSGVCFQNLKNIKHYENPLFTTEDDVDIFKGDLYWSINLYTWSIHQNPAYDLDNSTWKIKNAKNFSTKKKAIKYIHHNKPCLSYKDIFDAFGLKTWTSGDDVLENLVNNKL